MGIYGIWSNPQGRVVLIRKARGPYVGLLDLPGGSPEPGESPEETLRRELVEECGVRVAAVRSWHAFDLRVSRDSAGRPIDFRHKGQIAVLDVADKHFAVHDVEDVAAVEEHDLAGLSAAECSAPLWEARALIDLLL
ncbi:NUDIX domain-containing protein [Ruania sp. N2-46]|uniref:NUDIX domain-containing protein n=1 Tax=Occultella gossypii TaxID=2800820 RepID=A0ABS7SDN7_9MICO|nr:NUDIX domain-containing protein [Occultella gossypii]